MFSVLMVMPYQASFNAWLFVPLLMLPLLAVTVPKVRKLSIAATVAGLLFSLALIIIAIDCSSWFYAFECWLLGGGK